MKKSFGIILTICFALTAALQPAVLAQMTSGGPTPEELAAAKEIVVECDGSGATRQDALRDAMRKAIEKAVGMYVLSKTTMTDQELKEQVIVTSDAVVTNYKELKSEEEEGIWTVRIEARVLPNEYLKFCPKNASQDVSLEIGNLLNTMGSLNNTEAILDEIYEEDLFFKLYKFQKTEVKLGGDVELNGENVSLKVDFTASIDQDEYKKFQARICAFLASHLALQNYLLETGSTYKATLHTHPIELVAMSHIQRFLKGDEMTRVLWSMIPETLAFAPLGIGIVPYALPSSVSLAEATLEQIKTHDVVMWEKHGTVAVGTDIMDAFDQTDVLCKAANIYMCARAMGSEPDGMTEAQMKEVQDVFQLPKKRPC